MSYMDPARVQGGKRGGRRRIQMEETKAHTSDGNTPQQGESHPPSKFWIDLVTLFVLTITMGGVLYYACAAHTQNILLAKSVAQQMQVSRPVVLSNTFQAVQETTAGVPVTAGIAFINYGKSVALSVGTPGALVVQNPEDGTPVDPRCDENTALPKDIQTTALATVDAYGGNPPNANIQHWNLRRSDDPSEVTSGKTLYGTGCVYYKGLDGKSYFSDICVIWEHGGFVSCTDPKRNYVH